MAAVQIFLSTVSAEFETYREALQQYLSARGRTVSIQEDFAASGTPTLDKLDGYVRSSDVVVHLLGDLPGAMAQPRSVEYLRDTYPDFADRFPVLRAYLLPSGLALSYTQWEAWLALYHRKHIIVAEPLPGAPRGPCYQPPSEADRAAQQTHRERLADNECHVEIHFASIEQLAIALHQVLAETATGAAKPCDLPPAADHFVGRVDALAELTRRLRAGRNVTVTGGPGMGKTALAAAALRQVLGDGGERLHSSRWPDGVLNVDLYAHHGMADAAWHALADRLRGPTFAADHAAQVRAREAVKDQRLLIVVEGAEQADGLEGRALLADFRRALGSTCRWLVLTRTDSQATPAERLALQKALSDAEAGELFDALARDDNGRLPPVDVRAGVLALLQGHPLAITWAAPLLGYGGDDPAQFLRDWQAQPLPDLREPGRPLHTLAWLFDRSVSRLSDTARAVLAVAGCLAPTPVPLPAFSSALPASDESTLRAGLRSAVQHGLLRLSDDSPSWQFVHVLAHGYTRERLPAPEPVPVALADWLMATLQPQLGLNGGAPDSAGVAASLEHAAALLQADSKRQLWGSLLNPLLYDVRDRLEGLGWSALVEADLAAIGRGLDALPRDEAAGDEVERERGVLGNRLADLARVRGDLAGAEKGYRSSLALRERLVRVDPRNLQWQRDLGLSQEAIGNVLKAQGDLAGAESAYRSSLAVMHSLVRADPSNPLFQRDLAISQTNIGDVLIAQRDLAGAKSAYLSSLAVMEGLVQTYPNNQKWERGLSVSQEKIGDVLSAEGDLAGAEMAYRASLAVRERLAQDNPRDVQCQRDLSVSQEVIGNVLTRRGDFAGAESAYRSSLAAMERLAQKDPRNEEWQRDLFAMLWRIADFLDQQGDRPGAQPVAKRGLAIAQRLAALDPWNVTWQKDLGVCEALVQRLGG